MRHRLALFAATLTACLAASPAPAVVAAPLDDVCTQISPIGLPCVGGAKLTDALAAECRRLGIPDTACVLPLGHSVVATDRAAYLKSWVHRAAALQYRLQDSIPLGQVQWLGTHNSFNSVNDTITLSHTDSNQQLSLTEQLDIDVRALELDIHFINGVPTVCHGQGPDVADLGCTTEEPLSAVLPRLAAWLNRPDHRDVVILLYVEDELKKAAAIPPAVAQFDAALKRPDGSSLIYRPKPGSAAKNGCTPMPRDISRNAIRKSGAQILMVGNCVKGWAVDVHDWNVNEVESGDAAAFKPFPACDATYKRDVYDAKLIRYFEDSTFVSAVTDPLGPSVDPGKLTPAKAAAMTGCGVNLFGFDQLLPQDGRIEATIFSWAKDQPDAAAGTCTAQRSDGRWTTRACATRLRVACRAKSGWRLTRTAVKFAKAAAACHKVKAKFTPPRTGYFNSLVRQMAGTSEVWLGHRVRT